MRPRTLVTLMIMSAMTLLVSPVVATAGAATSKTVEAKQFHADLAKYNATWNRFGNEVAGWKNTTADRVMLAQAALSTRIESSHTCASKTATRG